MGRETGSVLTAGCCPSDPGCQGFAAPTQARPTYIALAAAAAATTDRGGASDCRRGLLVKGQQTAVKDAGASYRITSHCAVSVVVLSQIFAEKF